MEQRIQSAIINSLMPFEMLSVHLFNLMAQFTTDLNIDYDGNFECSKIVAVSLNEEEEVKIFPNPFNDEITINNNFLTNESLQAEIFDITGRRILAQTISATETKMDLSTIQISGIYFLKVNGKVFKLIKN